MWHELRRAAVVAIKPRVSPQTWESLRRWGKSQPRKPSRPPHHPDRPKPVTPLAERSLADLAQHFGTDKWGTHRYAQHYEHHLGALKHADLTLFEIGIGGYRREGKGGASLRMWKAFFPNAQIIGLDIEDKSFVDEPRIRTVRGSQTDESVLRGIVSEAHDLRVVIDDGSHRCDHIRETFAIVFPLLPAGSLYAIEDIQTSYWPSYGGALDLEESSTSMGLVKRLIDGLNYEEWQDDDHPATDIDRSIVAVHCYHNLVIIEKGENAEGTNRRPYHRPVPSGQV